MKKKHLKIFRAIYKFIKKKLEILYKNSNENKTHTDVSTFLYQRILNKLEIF